MKGFLKKKKDQSEQADMELELINLDETSGWSRLEVAHELMRQEAAEGESLQADVEMAEELCPDELPERMRTMILTEEAETMEAETMEAAEEGEAFESAVEAEYVEDEYAEDEYMEDGYMEDEEEELPEAVEYLTMEEEEEEEEEEEPRQFVRRRRRGWSARFNTMDKIVAGTGLAIFVLAIVTAVAFLGKRATMQQIEALAPVGEQLETVGILGEDTLLAVGDARKAMEEAASLEEELLKEYEEEELTTEVKVSMKLTSVQKDLKIKFINSKSGKLVGNVPFEVQITPPEGKAYTQKDEDMDGIIYLTKLEPGQYKVAMLELTGMEGYSFSTGEESIKVKESIDYQKIDVSDEIKDASQVNVAQEDTAAKVETEATLTDTVEWVESTRTETNTAATYVEIPKSDITEPSVQASLKLLRSFYLTSEVKPAVPDTEQETKPGTGDSGTTAPEGGSSGSSGTGGESGSGSATAPGTGDNQTPGGGGTTTPGDQNGGNSGGTNPPETSEPETEAPKPQETVITLSHTSLSLVEGQTATLTATVTPENAADKTLSWSSSAESIAQVNGGTVTALKAGTADITVKAGGKEATCKVTVTAKQEETQISLDRTTATLKTGDVLTLNATVTPAGKNLSWSSSAQSVATVENGVVTAKSAGETVITVTADGKSATCKVTVTASYDPRQDTATVLKTKDGKTVYYYANGQYIEAKVADYYKYSTFYRQETTSEYKYTGWQNLDGKTYYFDKDGNKVTGEQVIQGAKYTFNSDGALHTGSGVLGIDVSTWNGNIDWAKVKNSGVSYVIIRTGFRGSTQGALVEDAKFRQNIQGATNAGLKVGVYFFTQAVNEVEAVEEASMVLSQIKNYKITYPVFIDVEGSGGRADALDAGTRTKVINAFCQTIQNGGYRAGIYANKTWLAQKMNISALSGYKIWLAQYNTQVTYGGKYDMWQYSDKGSIPGISTKVDMNLSYMSY
ncbi:MAG: GH25 family lysozyme [Kineothrix sp.]